MRSSRKFVLICFLTAMVTSYVVLCPIVNPGFYRPFWFVSVHIPPRLISFAQFGVSAPTDLHVKTKDAEIHAWYFPVEHSDKVVLFCHGTLCNMACYLPFVHPLELAGASVMLYDARGSGETKGECSLTHCCQDGLAMFDYLVNEQHVQPQNIFVFGESLGSGTACRIAHDRKCGGLILVSAFSSLKDEAIHLFEPLALYPDFLWPEGGFNNKLMLKGSNPNLLITHGADDPLIPVAQARLLFKVAKKPKDLVVYAHGGHSGELFAKGYGPAFVSRVALFIQPPPTANSQ